MASLLVHAGVNAQSSDVLLQGYNWTSPSNPIGWYNTVSNQAQAIANAGIDMVWLPPPSDAADPNGFLPRRLYSISSSYGSGNQLRNLIKNLNNRGIDCIADIVINHRVGMFGQADFVNPSWGCWAVVSNDGWSGACGNPDTGDLYGPARDIDHTNAQVRADYTAWLNWLKDDVGFSGWRYDYVRGFAPSYITQYNNATQPKFSVGELWPDFDINNTDANRQTIVNWVDATGGSSKAFDFTTKGILQVAVQNQYWRLSQNGQLPGLIGWWPARSVTFIDNHDTGGSQNYWPFPGNKVMEGYAYILTHPGTPTVFWDHLFDSGLYNQIRDLVWIRKRNGLTDESMVSIASATSNRYAAIIDGKVAMKIGPGDWSPPTGQGWVLKASGNNYAVWDKLPSTPPGFTVYIRAPQGVTGIPRIHFWGVQPGNLASTWPGPQLTQVCNGWFLYRFDNALSANFVFHNSQGLQTPDLFAWKDSYMVDLKWQDNKPNICKNVCNSSILFRAKMPGGYGQPYTYIWNSVPPATETPWPGFPMTPVANGWHEYTANCARCTNYIFNNNYNQQTVDLWTCGNVVYQPPAALQPLPGEDGFDLNSWSVVSLSPNPAQDFLQLAFNFAHETEVTIEIYDLSGKLVSAHAREWVPEGPSAIIHPVSELANGLYLARVLHGNEVYTAKFMKK